VSGTILFPIFAVIAILLWLAVRDARLHRNGNSLVRLLEERDHPLFCAYDAGLKCRILTINGPKTRWTPFVIAVILGEIVLYRVAPNELERCLTIETSYLRWFGRPEKYTSGANEIWVHAEINGEWRLIQLRLYRHRMQALVRALKEIATPEQITAYRRHRPYIHSGPVSARTAAQTIYGAWELQQAVDLYLTPVFLVVLDGTNVHRTFPLHTIQDIAAVERLDRPRAAGLVRFEVEEEPFAFALDQHAAFAEALAEAAKRTLEDPLYWQRKKKKPDDFDFFDEDDFDQDDDYEEDISDLERYSLGDNFLDQPTYDSSSRDDRWPDQRQANDDRL
jgi:hypothetical protein